MVSSASMRIAGEAQVDELEPKLGTCTCGVIECPLRVVQLCLWLIKQILCAHAASTRWARSGFDAALAWQTVSSKRPCNL